MKKIICSLFAIAIAFSSNAQMPFTLSGTSYTQDFDNIGNGLPTGWRVDTMANPNAGLGDDAISKFTATPITWGSNAGRGFKNYASADGLLAAASPTDQNASTDRVLGIKQVSAIGWDNNNSLTSAAFQITNTAGLNGFNLQFKLQSLLTSAKRYNNWIVQYGFGASPTFTTIATTPATLTLDSNYSNTLVSVNFGALLDNQNQAVWIRIMPADSTMGNGNRPSVGIDDFNLTWTGVAVNNIPQITSLTPIDNAINVPAGNTSLSVTFDKNITAGTGNITVYNLTDMTNQVIPVANATISGMSATIPNVTLLAGKNYAVQFDSTCFASGIYNCMGIYNNTLWNFSTQGVVLTQTSLNESFVGCNSPLLGSFTETSVVGTQTWRCSNYGRNDTDAVYMNGYSGGATLDNEDWLVSPLLDMSAMTAPYLHFWSKKRFSGNNTKEVFVSNNYTGDVTTATWVALPVSFANLDTIYSAFNNTDLTAYKSSNFNIAFKYVSSAAGSADEWSIDDVQITDGPVSIKTFEQSNLKLAVLGVAQQNNLNLLIESDTKSSFEITIIDILGNTLQSTKALVENGKNKMNISLPNLSNGIYFVKVSNNQLKGVLKFTVQ